MRITFDPGARADLDDIFAWIATENEAAAHKVLARIEARVPILRGEKLADLPVDAVIE